jgi:aspartyl-tRNA(Asn)/glutamyl-tRNA(Gln) amidotransferase subunit C
MPLGSSSVRKVFELSRITPRKGEIEKFSSQLDAVLDYMDSLNNVDTEEIEPVGNITGLSDIFRDDSVQQSLDTAEVLKNAPSEDGASFRVPKVF